jgi:hypothetical protein
VRLSAGYNLLQLDLTRTHRMDQTFVVIKDIRKSESNCVLVVDEGDVKEKWSSEGVTERAGRTGGVNISKLLYQIVGQTPMRIETAHW